MEYWIRQLAVKTRRSVKRVRLVRAYQKKLQATSYKRQATSHKLQATSNKQQATSFKRQVKLQAASVGCGPNRQAPSMAFRDDRSEDRGSRMTHKVLLVQKRLPGL